MFAFMFAFMFILPQVRASARKNSYNEDRMPNCLLLYLIPNHTYKEQCILVCTSRCNTVI